jgi:hypothetical protein
MPVSTVTNLINFREERIRQIAMLKQRKSVLMERIDTIDNSIEDAKAQINTLSSEIHNLLETMVPQIEVTCFGLDERKKKIYGAVVKFPGLDVKIYKILSYMDYFFEEPQIRPVEFHDRIKEAVGIWLMQEPDLSQYVDLTPEQKNIITVCIRNIERENAKMSRFQHNLID